MAELGFIGLGIMGKPMASHLVKAGHTVHVCDLAEEPVMYLCSLGAKKCSCCKEVTERSEIIFIMVPDTPDVEAVLWLDLWHFKISYQHPGVCNFFTHGLAILRLSLYLRPAECRQRFLGNAGG